MGLVNEAVPKEKLRERVRAIADVLLEKGPEVVKGAKDAYKRTMDLDWDMSGYHLQTGATCSSQEMSANRTSSSSWTTRPSSPVLGCTRVPPRNRT